MIKVSLFAEQEREAKLDKSAMRCARLAEHIDFAALAAEIDRVAASPGRERGGRPQFLTEFMVRVLLVQQLFSLSDEQMEFQFPDRLSFRRFVGLRQSSQIPDCTTIWTLKERLIAAGATESTFDAVNRQLAREACAPESDDTGGMRLTGSPEAYLTGLFLGLWLIVAIGAQNAFVLRQGLTGLHVALVVAVCVLADAALMTAGVGGVASSLAHRPWALDVLAAGGACFLGWYGLGGCQTRLVGSFATERVLRRRLVSAPRAPSNPGGLSLGSACVSRHRAAGGLRRRPAAQRFTPRVPRRRVYGRPRPVREPWIWRADASPRLCPSDSLERARRAGGTDHVDVAMRLVLRAF
jgi:hypothetical protein